MSFEFIEQSMDGVFLIKSNKNCDNRGFLVETYKKEIFIENGLNIDFVQENFSFSEYKTLRGLHFQKNKFSQDKLITVNYGSILDVIVDLRRESKTFGKYLKFELDSDISTMLFVPKGFAHGFLTLSDFACVSYKLSNYYNPNEQGGIIWNDKCLNIDWNINFEPLISEKDKKLSTFKQVIEKI